MRASLTAAPLLLLAATRLAAQRPPEPFVDRDLCPFECCTYGDWTAVDTIRVFPAPRRDAHAVLRILPGATFRAVTGDVRLRHVGVVVLRRPLRLETETGKPPLHLAAGDTAYVLSYVGEGNYRVWIRGYIQTYPAFWDDRHEIPPPTDREGVLVRASDEVWWVRVRTRTGRGGWIRMDRATVEGSDACR